MSEPTGEYKSKYKGQEIDDLLDEVNLPDATPTTDSAHLVTSGGVKEALDQKVDKEEGKGLSTNDYTDAEKTKLGALPTNAGLQIALGNKEDKSNKVTSFSNPTNKQYPSAKLVSDSLDKVKADVSSLLTRAGIAEGIADTISAGTAQEFLQRQSGGDGVNCIKRIKGKTIAWNQLVEDVNYTNTQTDTRATLLLWTMWIADGSVVGQNTLESTSGNHSYVLTVPTGSKELVFKHNGISQDLIIFKISVVAGHKIYLHYNTIKTDPTIVGGVEIDGMQCIDLTLLFNGSVPEGYTAADFEKMFPKSYYPYNAGELRSNDAEGLETVGFNQWGEEWGNYIWNEENGGVRHANSYSFGCAEHIPVLPSTNYYLASISGGVFYVLFYDAEKNFISYQYSAQSFTTPANCAYITFYSYQSYGTTYKNDICINLSDPSFNGTYEPYWQRVLALRLSELTGIPEGGTEADRVTMFPNGLGGAGSAFDSIFVENGVTKARRAMARVDLGILNWTLNETYGFVASPTPSPKAAFSAICEKYPFVGIYTNVVDKTCGYIFNTGLLVKDSAYSDAATLKAAMDGVYLEFELATPIVYTDLQYADGTPFTMPATILVDNYGTERIQAPEGATTPSAPFCCDSNYSISIANLVKKLNTL